MQTRKSHRMDSNEKAKEMADKYGLPLAVETASERVSLYHRCPDTCMYWSAVHEKLVGMANKAKPMTAKQKRAKKLERNKRND